MEKEKKINKRKRLQVIDKDGSLARDNLKG